LFVAVDLDEATRVAVEKLSRLVREDARIQQAGRASWVTRDRMHLTLHFAADADALLERRFVSLLAEPIRQESFNLTFRGLGFFPERGAPRVLWLGIGEGLDELRAVHRAISHRMGPHQRPDEPFHPHLTLARFRDRVVRDRLAEIRAFPAVAGPSPIDRVTLYESRLSPKGPTYTALATAPLQVTP
jgi:RNA 2',3'-cyclic 3'-phosphodiesterase